MVRVRAIGAEDHQASTSRTAAARPRAIIAAPARSARGGRARFGTVSSRSAGAVAQPGLALAVGAHARASRRPARSGVRPRRAPPGRVPHRSPAPRGRCRATDPAASAALREVVVRLRHREAAGGVGHGIALRPRATCGPHRGRCRSRRARPAARSTSPWRPRARSRAAGGRRRAAVDQDRHVAAAGLVVLADQQLARLGRGAPVHVAQVVAGDVLAQRVEGQVAHRELLAGRTVEVVGQAAGEERQVRHPRCDEQLERGLRCRSGGDQPDGVGLLVGSRAHAVHPARHRRQRDGLGVAGERGEERQAQADVVTPHRHG